MKRMMWMMILAAGLLASRTPAAFNDDVRQAFQGAVTDAQQDLKSSGLPTGEPIALLPIAGDQGDYVYGLLKNAVTAAGLTCVEGKTDPFWNEVMEEVKFDTLKGDILDAKTLVSFGKLKAARILLYGTVRDFSAEGSKVYVELELHASSVATKQHLWGRCFGKRYYVAKDVVGLVQLDDKVREALAKAFDRGVESLKASPKLKDIRTVAMVPLAGDLDRYATGLAEAMVSKTASLFPKNLDIKTLAEARSLLRDQPQQADAVLYGAVRDLSRKQETPGIFSDTDRLSAVIQVKIESAKEHEVLWSEQLLVSELYKQDKPAEAKAIMIWQWMKAHPLIPLGVIGAIIAFIVLRLIIKAGTRVR
jgi:hypothetical protein